MTEGNEIEAGAVSDYPFEVRSPLEPAEELEQLRSGCPVAHVRLPSGDQATLLTRYQDVRAMLADPRFNRYLTANDAARVSKTGGPFGRQGLSATDIRVGEGHLRWRRLVLRALTAARSDDMRPWIKGWANSLVDDLVAGPAPADLASVMAFPMTIGVICRLLGVPYEERETFTNLADTRLSHTNSPEVIEKAQQDFTDYFTALVADKRVNPGNDLISDLLHQDDEGEGRLTEAEIIQTGMEVFIAGYHTTAVMITKMTAILLSERSRWEALLADRSLIRTAVEEVLRYDLPRFGIPRYVSEEAEIDGSVLPAGETVICSLASAHRDGEAFEEPDEMDLRRAPNPHLAFGAGPYACVGQSLARVELHTVLDTLLDRIPTLDLAVHPTELKRRENRIIGGLQDLPVKW
ncbi:cytochrome P450 [Streptomyces sp. NPDC005492]|uniref:cytochrome P450 n=1 Tax=Streptomyces sp. NPDC005492 TaxID=3156883 RepID=UPI0033B0CF30